MLWPPHHRELNVHENLTTKVDCDATSLLKAPSHGYSYSQRHRHRHSHSLCCCHYCYLGLVQAFGVCASSFAARFNCMLCCCLFSGWLPCHPIQPNLTFTCLLHAHIHIYKHTYIHIQHMYLCVCVCIVCLHIACHLLPYSDKLISFCIIRSS